MRKASKYVSSLSTLLKVVNFDPASASRKYVERVVAGINSRRYKALLQAVFEGMFRVGDVLTIKVGSVTFEENHCLISVYGKTGV